MIEFKAEEGVKIKIKAKEEVKIEIKAEKGVKIEIKAKKGVKRDIKAEEEVATITCSGSQHVGNGSKVIIMLKKVTVVNNYHKRCTVH